MPRRRLHGETQKRRQKLQTAQLKRSRSPHRVAATHAPAEFERTQPPDRQDLEFLEVMRELRVQPNRRRTIPPHRLREIERVRIEDPSEAVDTFLEAMERLGVRPLKGANGERRKGERRDSSPSVPGAANRGERTPPAGAPAAPPAAQAAVSALPAVAAPRAATPSNPSNTAKHAVPPEPMHFVDEGASMDELIGGELDLRDKYDGAPPRSIAKVSARAAARLRDIDSGIDPDDTLDLHGKTQEEAIRMVQNFMLGAHERRLRSVLIITGRGLRSGAQGPVLREAVRHWLESSGARFLREFRFAPPRHGGEGAYWIEMK